jgi:DNA topoisomerase I
MPFSSIPKPKLNAVLQVAKESIGIFLLIELNMEKVIKLSHKEFLSLDKDYEKTASIVRLVYVRDTTPGISRIKKGNGYSYQYKGKTVSEKEKLERIKKLAIPPSWTEVWICPVENGHIQATGLDLRKRKQYRYHALWHTLRNETKFHRMIEFGKALPALRKQVEKDLSGKELNESKVLATVVSLMERTFIRVGSSDYEKANGSYGISTLKDQHVSIKGDSIRFSFTGKKGIDHDISLKSKKLAKIVKQCRDIPGKELFQYYSSNGDRKSIDSGMINNYIKAATELDFTAKDFRTWAGTLQALESFRSIGDAANDSETKKKIVSVLDDVSLKLGNSRTICKKYYVHPGLIKLYEDKKLLNYLKELDKLENANGVAGLTAAEKMMMKILAKLQ